jgi:hypothetical protein
VIEAPPVQLENGLARTIEETTSLPAASPIIEHATELGAFSVMGVGRKAGGELERNSLPADADANVCNLFYSQWVGRKAGVELSRPSLVNQRMSA